MGKSTLIIYIKKRAKLHVPLNEICHITPNAQKVKTLEFMIVKIRNTLTFF